MADLRTIFRLFRMLSAGIFLMAALLAAQTHKPLPKPGGAPGTGSNHRLILKDGSYQIVRKYEISGDRVR